MTPDARALKEYGGALTPYVRAVEPYGGALTPSKGAIERYVSALTPHDRSLEPSVGALTPYVRALAPHSSVLTLANGTLTLVADSLGARDRGFTRHRRRLVSRGSLAAARSTFRLAHLTESPYQGDVGLLCRPLALQPRCGRARTCRSLVP